MIDKNKEKIKSMLEKCAEIMRRMPSAKVQGYRSYWPDIVHSYEERCRWENTKPFVAPNKVEIAFMEQVLEYYRPLDPCETKLVWLRSERCPWKVICHKLGFCRSYLTAKYDEALAKMILWQIYKM